MEGTAVALHCSTNQPSVACLDAVVANSSRAKVSGVCCCLLHLGVGTTFRCLPTVSAGLRGVRGQTTAWSKSCLWRSECRPRVMCVLVVHAMCPRVTTEGLVGLWGAASAQQPSMHLTHMHRGPLPPQPPRCVQYVSMCDHAVGVVETAELLSANSALHAHTSVLVPPWPTGSASPARSRQQ